MNKPYTITIVHRIAFFYLYFASETDKQLASEEMVTICEKIESCLKKNINKEKNFNAWDILSESLNWYSSLNPQKKEETYIETMNYFHENFNTELKVLLIEDLKEIAESDGIVLDSEKKLIKKSIKILKN